MFDDIRDTLRTLSGRLDPDERRRQAAGMREALVHAKLGVQSLQAALADTEARLTAERGELEVVRRRQGYAADIGDTETVAIAERFAQQHADRVALLESKRMVQQQEVQLAEREYETMSGELRRILSGVAPSGEGRAAERGVGAHPGTDGSGGGEPGAGAGDAPGGLPDEPPVRRTRADREADAEARLAELKRRLGR